MAQDASSSKEWHGLAKADRGPAKKLRETLIISAAIVALLVQGYFAFALPDQPTAKLEMDALQ